jgi:Tfp pilus assembly protein PilO
MKSLAPLLIIIICVAAYFMYISPKLDEINTLRLKLAEYKTTLEQSKELKSTLDSMMSSYNAIPEEEKTRLDKIIPEKFNNVLFVTDVSGIAFKNGMVVKSVKLNEITQNSGSQVVAEPKDQQYKTITATFTLTGQYDQCMKMLKDIEDSLQLLDVKSLSVKESQKNTAGSTFEYLLEVNTYYLR